MRLLLFLFLGGVVSACSMHGEYASEDTRIEREVAQQQNRQIEAPKAANTCPREDGRCVEWADCVSHQENAEPKFSIAYAHLDRLNQIARRDICQRLDAHKISFETAKSEMLQLLRNYDEAVLAIYRKSPVHN